MDQPSAAGRSTIGHPAPCKSSREFASWLGLVPRQTGTEGSVRQLGMSKRGNVYLRTLLMHGARVIVSRSAHAHGAKACSSTAHTVSSSQHWRKAGAHNLCPPFPRYPVQRTAGRPDATTPATNDSITFMLKECKRSEMMAGR
ncbi:transposase [Massilia sp. NEAU-DD11]|uniref:Transposase n=1 Tax=Massilia cellulosiltytica TaxID=2683234 RepID=A0A7X3FYX7_9BURK|nr:transposase [Telluria cellulosilytica]